MRASAAASLGSLQAQADLALIPLNGTAHATALPSASFLFVKGPGFVSAAGITQALSVPDSHGTAPLSSPCLSCSMSLCLDATLRPHRPHQHQQRRGCRQRRGAGRYPRRSRYRRGPPSRRSRHDRRAHLRSTSPHLAAPAALVANPATAIAQAHRAALLDPAHSWSALLQNLARSSDSPGRSPAPDANRPWHILIGPVGTPQIELAGWNAQTSATPPTRKNCASPAPLCSQRPSRILLARRIARLRPARLRHQLCVAMAAQHAAFQVRPGPTTPPTAGFTLSTDSSSPASTGLPAPLPHGTPESISSSSQPTAPPSPFHRYLPRRRRIRCYEPGCTAAALGISAADLEVPSACCSPVPR